MKFRFALSAVAILGLLAGCEETPGEAGEEAALVAADMDPLAFEGIGAVETLEGKYEDDWFFAHDANFNTLAIGKIMVIDAGGGEMEYRGAIERRSSHLLSRGLTAVSCMLRRPSTRAERVGVVLTS